jgi:hypothetical protein
MATSRPFAYNAGSPITGTDQVGDLAIGVDSLDYTLSPGGVDWWIGPDEDLGYTICRTDIGNSHTTPVYLVNASIGFNRSTDKTEGTFVQLVNQEFSQSFSTGNQCKTWLNNNGYWTSWGLSGGGPSIVTSGLVLNLDAGNNSSYPGYGTTWTDLSNSNNNGTLIGGLTYDSSNGGSIVFSDSTSSSRKYITLDPSKIPTGNEVTLCFWSYGVSKTSTNTIFNSEISTDRRTMNIHQVYTNSNLYWDAGDGPGSFNYDRINSSAISDAQYLGWHYWVYTKNATTGIMNVYLDNSLLITGTGKTKPLSTPSYATIGADFLNGLYFAGRIAIVNIYNKELSTGDITQNFNVQRSRFGL